ncbi:MAG: hypothetical protein ACTH3D_12210 [Halomonas sp.]|uniref:hypothetical protein n=1 Tax=Halomonas sp. TaxID=1486246 RepID=UPI003F8ED8D5
MFVVELNNKTPLSRHLFDSDLSNINSREVEDYKERVDFLPDFIKGFMAVSLAWNRKVSDNDLLILQHKSSILKVNKSSEDYMIWSDLAQQQWTPR